MKLNLSPLHICLIVLILACTLLSSHFDLREMMDCGKTKIDATLTPTGIVPRCTHKPKTNECCQKDKSMYVAKCENIVPIVRDQYHVTDPRDINRTAGHMCDSMPNLCQWDYDTKNCVSNQS